IGDHLDAVAPRIEEVEERPVYEARAGGLGKVAHLGAVVDDQAEMALAIRVRRFGLHQRQKLVAHVDEGLGLAAPAQREAEDFSVEGERLLDVADFERDVIDADQAGERCRAHDAVSAEGWGICRRWRGERGGWRGAAKSSTEGCKDTARRAPWACGRDCGGLRFCGVLRHPRTWAALRLVAAGVPGKGGTTREGVERLEGGRVLVASIPSSHRVRAA